MLGQGNLPSSATSCRIEDVIDADRTVLQAQRYLEQVNNLRLSTTVVLVKTLDGRRQERAPLTSEQTA